MADAVIGSWLPYLAVAVFTAGSAARIVGWARKPVPLRVRLTPAPQTVAGVVADAAREVLLFRSLWRGRKEAWAGAWLFHVSLAFLVAGHLAGLAFAGGQFTLFGATAQASLALSARLGEVVGVSILAAVVYLLARRAAVPLLRAISEPGDYFVLLLLLAIVATGDWMRFLAPVELEAVRVYLAGLFSLHPGGLPESLLFKVHFTLVQGLLLYYPVSKLGHDCGILFTRWLAVADLPGTGEGLGEGVYR